jgi:hypothetical protein
MNKVMSFEVSLDGECDICHKELMDSDFIVVDKVRVTKPFAAFEFSVMSYHEHCWEEGKDNGP